MSKKARIIKGYYTRDEAQQCIDDWNSLPDVDKAEHILNDSRFYNNYISSKKSLAQDLTLVQILKGNDWPPKGLKI